MQEANSATKAKLNVLVVEDSEDAAAIEKHLLERAGFEVVECRVDTRSDFLRELQSDRWDILLVDIELPHFNGREALRLAREHKPNTPVIIVTGTVSDEAAVQLIQEGAADYVLKDRLARLAPAVRNALEQARIRRALQMALDSLLRERDEIRNVKQRWLETLDAVGDPILVHDEKFRVVRANRAYAERAGMPFSEIIGRPYFECFPRLAGPLPGCQHCIAQRESTPKRIGPKEEFTLDGGATFVSHVYAMEAHAGETGHAMHLFEDVSEVRRAKIQVAVSEQRFRALTENSSDLVIVVNASGRIAYASPSIKRLGGYEQNEVVGRNFLEFTHPEDQAVALTTWGELLRDPVTPQTTEYRYRQKNGSWIVLESIAKNAVADPSIQGIVINARNVTERRNAERSLTRSNRALRTLSAGNTALVRTAAEPALLAEMCRVIVSIGGYRFALVAYARNKSVALEAAYGLEGEDFAEFSKPWSETGDDLGTVRTVLRTGKPSIVHDVASDPRFEPWRALNAKFRLASVVTLPLRLATGEEPFGALSIGALDSGAFGDEELRLLIELSEDLGYGVANLRSGVERRAASEKLRRSLEDSIGAIAATVEMRDPYTSGHERRVAALATAIAKGMRLPADVVEGIHFGGLIHDLGKIQIPAEILAKPTRLNAIEYELIKMHPQSGFDILKGIDFPWPVAQMVLQHHERLDGSGYPRGLKGDDIIVEARVLAVADVIEAMASHRPYRPGLGIDKALGEIEGGAGRIYDANASTEALRLFREKGYSFPV